MLKTRRIFLWGITTILMVMLPPTSIFAAGKTSTQTDGWKLVTITAPSDLTLTQPGQSGLSIVWTLSYSNPGRVHNPFEIVNGMPREAYDDECIVSQSTFTYQISYDVDYRNGTVLENQIMITNSWNKPSKSVTYNIPSLISGIYHFMLNTSYLVTYCQYRGGTTLTLIKNGLVKVSDEVIVTVPGPSLLWTSPDTNSIVTLPKDNNVFTIGFTANALDEVRLKINNQDQGVVTSGNPITYNGNSWGSVAAILNGYKNGQKVIESSRNLIIRKVLTDQEEIIQEDYTNVGKQLYLILHDPSGDNSFSSYEESSSLAISTKIEKTEGYSGSIEFKAEAKLWGLGAMASDKITVGHTWENNDDMMLKVTDKTFLTSSQISANKNEIGSGYGDRYWGEAWTIHTQLKAKHVVYTNNQEEYLSPIWYYGVNRQGELFVNDIDAPEEWRNLNPAHNNYADVVWIQESHTAYGGAPYTGTHIVDSTVTNSRAFTLTVSNDAAFKLGITTTALTMSIKTKTTTTTAQGSTITTSYTIKDDDVGDIICQKIGIDNRYGTYIFQANTDTSSTSSPLEHNTMDRTPPVVNNVNINLDPNNDLIAPGTNDCPILTAEITDDDLVSSAFAYFSIDDGSTWNVAILHNLPTNQRYWQGTLPAFPIGTTIFWYIKSVDRSGFTSYKYDTLGVPFQYSVMNSPPSVELLTPVGGNIYQKEVLIEWNANDVDMDGLTFELQYNIANTGWHIISQDITEMNYLWDISNLPYSQNYVIKIIAKDSAGASTEFITPISFTVDDIPSLSSPEDISYLEGDQSEFYLSWIVNDAFSVSSTYKIYLDGIQKKSGIWDSNTPIKLYVGGFNEGIYQFTIEISDGFNVYSDDVYLWVLSGVNNELSTIGGNELEDQTEYNDVPLGDSGIIINSIYTSSVEETTITAGIWYSNPTSGTAPFNDDALYFAIDSPQQDNIIFDNPSQPFMITIPLPMNYDPNIDTIQLVTWDESTSTWIETGFGYTININDWTAIIQMEHFSIFAFIILDDDTTAPICNININSGFTDADSGIISWTAFDSSGIFSVGIEMSVNGGEWTTVNEAFITNNNQNTAGDIIIPNELGTYQYRIRVTDGDLDCNGDSLTSDWIETELFTIIDDDTSVDISNLACQYTIESVIFSFTDIDTSQIGSLDWITVDDVACTDYFIEGNTITIPNRWIFAVGIHAIQFQLTDKDSDRSDDTASSSFTINFEIIPIDPLIVSEYDSNCGFGSERFGLTLNYAFEKVTTIYADIEEWTNVDGDNKLNERYSTILRQNVQGIGTTELIFKIYFNEENKTTDGKSGRYYRYHIWTNTGEELAVNNIGLYHWSKFENGKVKWDAITTNVSEKYTVYVQFRYWNKTSGIISNVADSQGNLIKNSYNLTSLNAGIMDLPLNIPSKKILQTTSYDVSAWMKNYDSGYYQFTFISPTDAVDAWAERIGCPPEFVEI